MTVICEISNEHEVAVSLLNDEGIVISSVPIATIVGGEMTPTEAAEGYLVANGWQPAGEWNLGDDFSFCVVVPKTISVAFAGTEIPDEQALAGVRNAGYEVNSVVSQTFIPETGRTYVHFSVDLPPKWQWPSSPLL